MPSEPVPRPLCAARAALPLVIVLAAGCAGDGWQSGPVEAPVHLTALESLSLTMKSGANANWPARVELVRVQDPRLVSDLVRIEISDWFGAAGEAFRRLHPEAFYDRWEVVPGIGAGPFRMDVELAVAGVLFCETRAGAAPLRMERDGHVTVDVDIGCTIAGGRPSSRRPGDWSWSKWSPVKWKLF